MVAAPRGTRRAGPLKYPVGPSAPRAARAGNFADESARPLVPIVLQGLRRRLSRPPRRWAAFRPTPWASSTSPATWRSGSTTCYSIPPAEAPPERDPDGPPPGELHVIRGSSFLHGSVTELRLSYRDYGGRSRAPDVGFRIARYAE